MSAKDLLHWKWGGLRNWDDETQPWLGFRQRMEQLHREMDRLFEGALTEGFGRTPWSKARGGDEIVPELDVTDDEKAFRVSIELPGMDEKDVHVTLADRVLTIRGEKKEEKQSKEKDFYRQERSYGSFCRTLELPAAVDESKIEAAFKKGVLTIDLPKTKEAQQKIKHISVKAA